MLQKEAVRAEIREEMCDADFLTNHDNCGFIKCNTRPLQVFCHCNEPLRFADDRCDTSCGEHGSCVLRVERVEGNAAIFRALKEENGKLKSTDSFITIRTENIQAVRCMKDTFVELCI